MNTVDAAIASFLQRADADELIDVAVAPIDTPVGRMHLAATPTGLVKVDLHGIDTFADELAATVSPRVLERPERLEPVRRQLEEYFDGKRTTFDLAIDWRLSKGFRRDVLQRLHARIGFGQVVSYRELAEQVGNPKASRAVGTAMATNPLPIVVPCHRVLRTGGALGGYGGGLPMKRALLALEGVLLA